MKSEAESDYRGGRVRLERTTWRVREGGRIRAAGEVRLETTTGGGSEGASDYCGSEAGGVYWEGLGAGKRLFADGHFRSEAGSD